MDMGAQYRAEQEVQATRAIQYAQLRDAQWAVWLSSFLPNNNAQMSPYDQALLALQGGDAVPQGTLEAAFIQASTARRLWGPVLTGLAALVAGPVAYRVLRRS